MAGRGRDGRRPVGDRAGDQRGVGVADEWGAWVGCQSPGLAAQMNLFAFVIDKDDAFVHAGIAVEVARAGFDGAGVVGG
ncbi:hypothetical protein D3C72_2029000 [compost metagenome]